MDSLQRRNLILLALGQGLTGSIISLMTLCSTLVGVSMTSVPLLTSLSAGSLMALTSGWPLVNMMGIGMLLLLVLALVLSGRR
ncbi:hypothetical protein [Pectobacterium sp. B2J-2]|uniref:hypothetical protein n=1 Tax=Pectobacterium sp. B2J-2 TaxID=3385372 RepID=UPI0038FCB19D